MDKDTFDLIKSLLILAFLFIVLGSTFYIEDYDFNKVAPVASVEETQETTSTSAPTYPKARAHHEHIRFILEITPVFYNTEIDTSEYTCLLYAIEPIGRYYITAYNHLETGGKRTASGTICHEGNITTCAADVWGGYFKFGDYIEVGGRLYRVEDTGSAVKKRHIDIYFANYKEMANFNSHYETIYRVSFPFGIPGEGEQNGTF